MRVPFPGRGGAKKSRERKYDPLAAHHKLSREKGKAKQAGHPKNCYERAAGGAETEATSLVETSAGRSPWPEAAAAVVKRRRGSWSALSADGLSHNSDYPRLWAMTHDP